MYKLEIYSKEKGTFKIVGIDFEAPLKKIAEGDEFIIFKVPSRRCWAGIGAYHNRPMMYIVWDKTNGTFEECAQWKPQDEETK